MAGQETAIPAVDMVIPVHAPTRPIERAVGSVLNGTAASVRVTVVVHNTDPAPIRHRLLAFVDDPRLRIVTYTDGIPSPAGPMNHGFDLAEAPYVALLGSDDTVETGAIDVWLRASRTASGPADAVVAPIRDAAGALRHSPPIRWHRGIRGRTLLDPVKDRLSYRSGNIGLISRERFAELRLAEGYQTGEDQPFSATVWFTPGSRIVFPVNGPGFREGDDADDRVTFARRAVGEEFRVLDALLIDGAPWMIAPQNRRSFLVKFVRVHLFDAVRNRVDGGWNADDAEELAGVAQRILDTDPGLIHVLARADEELLWAILDSTSAEVELRRLLRARSRLRSAGALMPSAWRYALHSQAPLRHHVAGALLLRRTRRAERAVAS